MADQTWQADIQVDGATLRERVWSILEEEQAAERPDPTLIAALTAALAQPDAGEDKWRDAVDRELMVQGSTIDTFDRDPARCLNEIVKWNQVIAVDPAVNGGFKLVPADTPPPSPQPSLTREERDEVESALLAVAHRMRRVKWSDKRGADKLEAIAAKCRTYAEPEPGR